MCSAIQSAVWAGSWAVLARSGPPILPRGALAEPPERWHFWQWYSNSSLAEALADGGGPPGPAGPPGPPGGGEVEAVSAGLLQPTARSSTPARPASARSRGFMDVPLRKE